MRILEDVKLSFDDVLIVPQHSDIDSRADVTLKRTFTSRNMAVPPFSIIPIIVSNMYNTGTVKMAEAIPSIMTAFHKYNNFDNTNVWLLDGNFITIGESAVDLDKLLNLPIRPRFVCIDVANGYRSSFINFVRKVREAFPCSWIMAGNVTTADVTSELILAGADIVKVGIGPGSACKTRKVTGVGYGQLSAIIECADAAHRLCGFICADGGCRESGDIAKAFCVGADFVMLGSMFAGCNENDGEWVDKPCYGSDQYSMTSSCMSYKKYLKFFGMSSKEAMEKFGGKDKQYRASEGISTLVESKGPAAGVLAEILGGLRSCGSYIDADCIKAFPRRVTLCKVYR